MHSAARNLAPSLPERYHLKESLGRGASSEVYRATDRHLGREVAIKAIAPSILAALGSRQRFLDEASLQARLEHGNIVRIYDLCEGPDRLYMVLQLVQGITLETHIIQQGGLLAPEVALDIYDQILAGVGHAHERGIIHQDLKPENVQITDAGEVLILDLGLARLIGQKSTDKSGRIAGTPRYMAPEQAEERYLDPRTDIYALGMMFYEMITGHHPFEAAGTVTQLLTWQIKRLPVPPSVYNEEVPEAADRVLLKALAKRPSERYRSCAELGEALHAAWAPQAVWTDPGAAEGRWDPRIKIDAAVTLQQADGAAQLALRTIDLSAGGLALWLHRPLGVGDIVRLALQPPPEFALDRIRALAEVVWANPNEETNGYRAGLRFIDIEDGEREKVAHLVRHVLVTSA